MHTRRAHDLLSLLLALCAMLGGAADSRADALDGVLEVKSAYAQPEQGVYQLFARVAYPVNDDIRAALKDGLTLTFDLDVVVSRDRRFWMTRPSRSTRSSASSAITPSATATSSATWIRATAATSTAIPPSKRRSMPSAPSTPGLSC